MLNFIKRYARDNSGATAIEYALIASLICTGLIVGASQIGIFLQNSLNNSANAVNGS
ncbi:MAG: Flp family type IVb pilin [Robiginitomaculum sp.]